MRAAKRALMAPAVSSGPDFFGNYTMFHEFWAEDPDWTDPGDGGSVSSWRNNGTDGTAAVEATAGEQPTFRATASVLNNRPAIEWNNSATADRLQAPRASTGQLDQRFTHGLVFCFGSSGNQIGVTGGLNTTRGILDQSGGNFRAYNGAALTAGAADTDPHLMICDANGASSELRLDGNSSATGNSGTNPLDGVTFGANYALSGGFADVHIAYYFAYSGDLTADAGFSSWETSILTYYGI